MICIHGELGPCEMCSEMIEAAQDQSQGTGALPQSVPPAQEEKGKAQEEAEAYLLRTLVDEAPKEVRNHARHAFLVGARSRDARIKELEDAANPTGIYDLARKLQAQLTEKDALLASHGEELERLRAQLAGCGVAAGQIWTGEEMSFGEFCPKCRKYYGDEDWHCKCDPPLDKDKLTEKMRADLESGELSRAVQKCKVDAYISNEPDSVKHMRWRKK